MPVRLGKPPHLVLNAVQLQEAPLRKKVTPRSAAAGHALVGGAVDGRRDCLLAALVGRLLQWAAALGQNQIWRSGYTLLTST